MERWLPEYINYWFEIGFDKFLRVFWLFLIFEFTRYIILEFIIIGRYKIFQKKYDERFETARQRLRNEKPLISIVIPGKNEGVHLYKLVNSLKEQTYRHYEPHHC